MSKDEFSFENYSKLKEASISVAEVLKSKTDTIAVAAKSHPDNLSASGILVSCLQEHDVGSHIVTVSNSEDTDARVKNSDYSTYVFIGLAVQELPVKILNDKDRETIIIGHDFTIDEKIKVPWEIIKILSLSNFDLKDNLLSNSGIAYLISSGFSEEHHQYSGLAILGALARRQVNKKRKLIGINKLIFEEGKEHKILKEINKAIKIPGRESQPIHQALQYSINPFFPGLTGNKDACTSFVSELEISMKDNEGNFRTISSLTKEEGLKLSEGLIILLKGDASKIIGPMYIIETETKKDQTRNIEEFLWLLEGAIGMEKYGLALVIVLGDRSNLFDKLMRELGNYHGKATTIIEEIIQNQEIIEEREYYRLIRNQDFFEFESAPLVIRALVGSKIIPINKPLILHIENNKKHYLFIHDSPSNIKKGYVSFQIFQELIEKVIKESSVKGDIDFFQLNINAEELETVLEKLGESLSYHHEGKESEKETIALSEIDAYSKN